MYSVVWMSRTLRCLLSSLVTLATFTFPLFISVLRSISFIMAGLKIGNDTEDMFYENLSLGLAKVLSKSLVMEKRLRSLKLIYFHYR